MAEHNVPNDVAFVNRVMGALQALGYRVIHQVGEGAHFDLLCEVSAPLVGNMRLAVGCEYRRGDKISRSEVLEFLETLSDCKGTIDSGIIVTTDGFSPAALEEANGTASLQLMTLDELQRGDPMVGLLRRIDEYQLSPAYMRFVQLEASLRGEARRDVTALPYVLDRLRAHDPSLIFVLADFGAGKTTLLERLRYELAVEYVRGSTPLAPTPLLVNLREYDQAGGLEALLKRTLREEFGGDVPLRRFWEQAESGAFVFLLDGFDEMTGRSDMEERTRLLVELNPLLSGPSSAVLSCRPSYFSQPNEYVEHVRELNRRHTLALRHTESRRPDGSRKSRASAELREALRQRFEPHSGHDLGLPPVVETIDLIALDRSKRIEFIGKSGVGILNSSGLTAEDLLDRLESIYDLRDLATRPILLDMLIDTIEHGTIDILGRSKDIGPAQLYEEYTSMKLEWDWRKGPSRRAVLNPDQRRQVAIEIAKTMLASDSLEISLVEIIEQVRNVRLDPYGGPTLGELATDVATCAFIVRSGDERFRFSHKSFAEFFVARDLAFGAHSSYRWHGLTDPTISIEVLYFLGSFAMADPDLALLLRTALTELDADQATARRNAAIALLYSGSALSNLHLQGLHLSDLRLRGVRMEQGELASVELRSSTLEEIELAGTELENVSFRDSTLTDVAIRPRGAASIALYDCAIVGGIVSGSIELIANSCSIARWSWAGARLRLCLARSVLNELDAKKCDVEILGDSSSSSINTLDLVSSRLDVQSEVDSSARLDIGGSSLRGVLIEVKSTLVLKECTLVNCLVIVSESGNLSLEGCNLSSTIVVPRSFQSDSAPRPVIQLANTTLEESSMAVGFNFKSDSKSNSCDASSLAGCAVQPDSLAERLESLEGKEDERSWACLDVDFISTCVTPHLADPRLQDPATLPNIDFEQALADVMACMHRSIPASSLGATFNVSKDSCYSVL